MMTLDEIRKALQDRRLSMVADSTGLSYQTVYNIRRGTNGDVAYSTAKALSDYLKEGAVHGQPQ